MGKKNKKSNGTNEVLQVKNDSKLKCKSKLYYQKKKKKKNLEKKMEKKTCFPPWNMVHVQFLSLKISLNFFLSNTWEKCKEGWSEFFYFLFIFCIFPDKSRNFKILRMIIEVKLYAQK